MNKDRKKFLINLKKYGIENDIPNISETTGEMLSFLIKHKKVKSLLEIGCANGYSTIWFADALEKTGGKMVSYDVSFPSFEEAKKNLKDTTLDHLVDFRFGDAKILLKNVKEKFDFVFIDARKSFYHIFWQLIKPLLTENALVVCDDVIKFKDKMKEFYEVIEAEKEFEKCIIPVDFDDGIMLIQRK